MNENFAEMHGEPWPGPHWGPAYEPEPVKGMESVDFDEIDIAVSKQWITKGVIALGETSSWIGGPGAGKSALLTDLSIHIAAGWDWRGYKSKGRFGVIYLAFERGGLVKRRLEAYKRKFNLHGLPIAVVSSPSVDIMDPSSVGLISATIREHADRWGTPVGLVILDTFGKALAKGNGDENSAKDQNRSLGHLRLVEEDTNVHVALIGHTGKDEARGARGSNAHAGDVDTMAQISGDKTKTATIIKGNDQADGVLTNYVMESFSFGVDEDGDPVDVGIVTSDIPDAPAKKAPSAVLTAAEKVAYRLLRSTIEEAGETPPAGDHVPQGVKVVSVTLWRRYCYQGGISAADTDDAKQKAFKRAVAALQGKDVIGVWEPYVWIARDVSV